MGVLKGEWGAANPELGGPETPPPPLPSPSQACRARGAVGASPPSGPRTPGRPSLGRLPPAHSSLVIKLHVTQRRTPHTVFK